MLTGLVKLKTLRKEYPEPQTRARLPTFRVKWEASRTFLA